MYITPTFLSSGPGEAGPLPQSGRKAWSWDQPEVLGFQYLPPHGIVA